jgi:cytochrome c553
LPFGDIALQQNNAKSRASNRPNQNNNGRTMERSGVGEASMKVVVLKICLQSAVIAFALSGAGYAAERSRSTGSSQAIENKFAYCQTCHGLSAQGFRGYFTMPRLAGQHPQYIQNQLHAFIQHRRLNSVMYNVTRGLTPEMIGPLAQRFAALNPPPFGGAPNESLALGKSIFQAGLPESNVPACAICHGPDAKGTGQIPRLAGQLYWYITKTLANWGEERGQGPVQDISAIMKPTAHNLTPAQVSAIAAYVSNLK